DERTWYPAGRDLGRSCYPGVALALNLLLFFVERFSLAIEPLHIAVLMGPAAALACVGGTYCLARQICGRDEEALLAAFFSSVIPALLSCTECGVLDGVGIGCSCMIFAFYHVARGKGSNRTLSSVFAGFLYFAMAISWEEHTFFLNLFAVYVLFLLFKGLDAADFNFTFQVVYLVGMSSTQLFLRHVPSILTREHAIPHAAFFLLLCRASGILAGRSLPFLSLPFLSAALPLCLFFASGWLEGGEGEGGGGLWRQILPMNASSAYETMTSSVSENQPTTWSSFFFDLHCLLFLAPLGIYRCISEPNERSFLLIFYFFASLFLSALKVRFIVLFAPAACIIGAIGASSLLSKNFLHVKVTCKLLLYFQSSKKVSRKGTEDTTNRDIALLLLLALFFLFIMFLWHCSWVTSVVYAPSTLKFAGRQSDGNRTRFEDMEEGMTWIRDNTDKDARVLSWWDHGHELASLADRVTFLDASGYNLSQVAAVGAIMALPEEEAAARCRNMGVNFVLVRFGGMTSFASDDISKFLWMVRAAGKELKEPEDAFLSAGGVLRVGKEGSRRFRSSLLYRLSFHRFSSQVSEFGRPAGFDRVRGEVAEGGKEPLQHFEEVFTSQHWLLRLYRVKNL
ncbi:hypothetical protein GUITHDRAFT_62986, partial [Guillardia theta CCMP2712]